MPVFREVSASQWLSRVCGPGYTKEAIEKGIEGIVVLEWIFRKNGRVEDCKGLKSLDPGLDQNAIDNITSN